MISFSDYVRISYVVALLPRKQEPTWVTWMVDQKLFHSFLFKKILFNYFKV